MITSIGILCCTGIHAKEEHFFVGLGDGVLGLLTASPWCIFVLVNDIALFFLIVLVA
jgi:hypothetical protein